MSGQHRAKPPFPERIPAPRAPSTALSRRPSGAAGSPTRVTGGVGPLTHGQGHVPQPSGAACPQGRAQHCPRRWGPAALGGRAGAAWAGRGARSGRGSTAQARPAPPPWRCASPPTSHGSSRSSRLCRRGWKRRRPPGSERWRRLGRRAARPRSCGRRRSGRGCGSRSSTPLPVRPRPAAPPGRGVARTLRRPCRSLPGDPEAGELGLAAVPGRQAAFRQGLEAAVHYARAVGCPR